MLQAAVAGVGPAHVALGVFHPGIALMAVDLPVEHVSLAGSQVEVAMMDFGLFSSIRFKSAASAGLHCS